MAESAKYIWCQHCYTGWIAKEDKPYYPKCWSCGMGWRKRTRRPRWWSAEDAWDAQWPQAYPAQEVGCYPPPGLGRPARTQMTTAEYRTAVAQLWGSAGQQGSHHRNHSSAFDVWMSEKPAPRKYGPWLPGKEAKSASREARSGLGYQIAGAVQVAAYQRGERS